MAHSPISLNTLPARGGVAPTLSDSANEATPFRGIFVGGAGNISMVGLDGAAFTLTGVLAGVVYQIAGLRINTTGTTATNLILLL